MSEPTHFPDISIRLVDDRIVELKEKDFHRYPYRRKGYAVYWTGYTLYCAWGPRFCPSCESTHDGWLVGRTIREIYDRIDREIETIAKGGGDD